MIATLQNYAKYEVPTHVLREIKDYADRYGQVKLVRAEEEGYLLIFLISYLIRYCIRYCVDGYLL